jgi:DNA/RNA non-specific endonuclease
MCIYVHGVNGNYFIKTYKLGRQVKASTKNLELDPTPRDAINNKTLGKLFGDHAGHLFGDRYGGSKLLANLVSMAGNRVNQGTFANIENIWAKAIDGGKKVAVNIKINYDGDGVRPISFVIEYKINGTKQKTVTIEN